MGLLILGIPLALSVGALAFHEFTTDTTQVVQQNTPNVALIAGLALAGVAIWMVAKKR